MLLMAAMDRYPFNRPRSIGYWRRTSRTLQQKETRTEFAPPLPSGHLGAMTHGNQLGGEVRCRWCGRCVALAGVPSQPSRRHIPTLKRNLYDLLPLV